MKFLTWDIGILAGAGILLAYCLLIRKHKALAILVSLYIAYVVTSLWGDRISQFFSGDRVLFNQLWIRASASQFSIQLVLLAVVTFLLSTFLKLGGRRSRYSVVEVAAYCVATALLGVLFMVTFMTPTMRDRAIHASHLIPLIYAWREWVLGAPVLLMIFFGIYNHEE